MFVSPAHPLIELAQFDGDVKKAVAAYYQGPAAVKKHGLFAETRRFVANVLALRSRDPEPSSA